MAMNPLPVLAIVTISLVFQGLLFGQEIAERSFPTFEKPEEGAWGALEAAGNVLLSLWGVVVFLYNLVSFNVPGAPWYARVIVGGITGSAVIWSIATLVRGN